MNGKIDIKSMLPEEIAAFLAPYGQPAYRARQIFSWLHRGAESFDEMTDLSRELRAFLQEKTVITVPKVEKRLVSDLDDTVKYLYAMQDGECVESVLMRYHHGDSVCVSTQAGCRMNCAFCASAIGGLKRNLTPSEILDQILFTSKRENRKVVSVVLMGTGEPLDNYDNVLRFLRLLGCEGGLRMSLRHVSLSTCGLVDRIYDLMKEKLQLTLSVSLHAPNDDIRSRIMPVSRRWDIDSLLAACRDYINATGRRISFEYAMLDGVNDSDACARELAARLRGMLCHVNLIPANEVRERAGAYRQSPAQRVRHFSDILSASGLNVTVRRTLGADINASCGQLRHAYRAGKGGS
jgi:23S rRNA (adenine2503-C2)-methyltransferase